MSRYVYLTAFLLEQIPHQITRKNPQERIRVTALYIEQQLRELLAPQTGQRVVLWDLQAMQVNTKRIQDLSPQAMKSLLTTLKKNKSLSKRRVKGPQEYLFPFV